MMPGIRDHLVKMIGALEMALDHARNANVGALDDHTSTALIRMGDRVQSIIDFFAAKANGGGQ